MEATLWPYGKCKNCANKNYCAWSHDEIMNCMNNGYLNYSPMRNADRIRSMSDEEMAKFLGSIIHDWCQGGAVILISGSEVYVDSWLDWLRQEAQDAP